MTTGAPKSADLAREDGILTQRLQLRRLRDADMDEYYRRIYADPAVMRGLPSGKPISRAAFEANAHAIMIDHWVEHAFGPWVVLHRASGDLVGHCGLKFWSESQDVEVFYALARDVWGQGLATERARASVEWGFRVLGLQRIIAATRPENRASQRVLEKIGMACTGPMELGELRLVGYALERPAAAM
jgi:ribosomal-protein-alanine N-acetyltransferase